MPDIPLYQPDSLEDALELLARVDGAWLLAGGQDTCGWLKDRAKSPTLLIDLGRIESLAGIQVDTTTQALRIGAMTTLTDIVQHPIIRERYSLLSDAAARVASPQIRNAGTLGGNLCQDARCWYYRRGLDCYRAGGNLCYADSPQGMNREHCLFGASRCVAVTPSDTASALVALDAILLITGPGKSRRMRAQDFFLGPDQDITHMVRLDPNEILTGIELPASWANARFRFEKIADRKVWDFALVSLASAFKLEGNRIVDVRLVYGGVACVPYRSPALEAALRGKPFAEASAQDAAPIAIAGAEPLNFNGFKLVLMKNLLLRAMRD